MTFSLKSSALALSVCALVAASGPAFARPAFKGAALQGPDDITLTQARAIALKAHPGRITDQELEKEGGGSGLRYSFDISNHGRTFEVGVDAKSGQVLENDAEGAHPD